MKLWKEQVSFLLVSYCLLTNVIISLSFLLLALRLTSGSLPPFVCLCLTVLSNHPQPTMWSHQAKADAKSEADRSAQKLNEIQKVEQKYWIKPTVQCWGALCAAEMLNVCSFFL